MQYRKEKDSLGEKDIPADVYWGIHTQRALENFPISGLKVNPALIKALAMVKKACASANQELGYLSQKKAGVIILACDEIIAGKMPEQFPIDALQGGAGTSTNMNLNEVIANRAIELSAGKKGDYALIHPIEDVNLHQSTNDVYPTALKIACIFSLRLLAEKIAGLQGALQQKEKEFSQIVKIGRTEFQEAVPITLGQEFSAFAEAIARDRWRTFKCEERLRVVNIGGTAVGTGISAPRDYIFAVIEKLRQVTGIGLARSENLIDATANADCFAEASGILKAHSVNLIKIANDLRLLNLLQEIKLPPAQVGSSIMAGKLNPVILEAVVQAGYKAIADDLLVTEAVARGSLQINEFMPLLAYAILEALGILNSINNIFCAHLEGIQADGNKCREYLDRSPGIITAFLPRIGYDKAAGLLKEFNASEQDNLREFLNTKLGKDLVDETLSAANLLRLGYKTNGKDT
jgi:aspartate ammonia-lyase